ncbi:MAG: GxxExxY protein [Ignavibacteriales bacterium UTCHB2]|nr:MAG: GxxExxY protein [Ignavibacteriales bacterium UTCHB2]
MTQKIVNDLAYKIVGCAIEVHKQLGPGLLENIYERCLKYELELNGLKVKTQIPVEVIYKGKKIDSDLRLDLLVEDLIIVELKAVETVIPLFQAQLITYLKLLKKPKGLLINFNCEIITKSLIPIVTNEFSKLPIE